MISAILYFLRKVEKFLWANRVSILKLLMVLATIFIIYFAPMGFVLAVCIAWLVFFLIYPLTYKTKETHAKL